MTQTNESTRISPAPSSNKLHLEMIKPYEYISFLTNVVCQQLWRRTLIALCTIKPVVLLLTGPVAEKRRTLGDRILCLRDRVASPVLQPPTWRTGSPYLYPLETGWPSCTPRHRVPILVAFYDMHELQWDYSFPRSPHGDVNTHYILHFHWLKQS
jgi:hypothetical protein